MNFLNSASKRSWGVSFRKALQLLGGMMGMLLLSLPLFSQGNFGRILGTVTDQSGGTVSGATVTVLDTDRGVSKVLVSNDAGEYNAPNLTPGTYKVRAESKGFKVFERQNILLEVGKEVRVDATLQPGDQNQTITITESIPLVETTNATLGGTLNTADIADLPLNGRDYQNLLGLRPGVMLQPGGGPWTQSTNGVRPDESVWMVDGIINMNFFDARPVINMPSPFTDGATILPIDAIQEFNLMENPKAEYGWKAGAVVNVGIKSGTNTLHGAAYAFGRSDSFDARNYYNVQATGAGCSVGPGSACDKLPVQLKQYGGVVGGKIKKDKLFFFGGYEALRSFIGSAFVNNIPTTAQMQAAITTLQGKGLPRSAVSEGLLGCSEPGGVATCGASTGFYVPQTVNPFLSSFPVTNVSDNGVGKLDWHPNDKNAVSGTFFLGNYTSTGEDHGFVNQAFTDNAPLRAWTVATSWVYTPNSTVVNEMRFGYDRTDFAFQNIDVSSKFYTTAGPGLLNTGITYPGGLPNINFNGQFTGLGTSTNRPQVFSPNPYFDFQDSVSVLKGKHSFKFGGEFAHIEADAAIYVNGRGTFNFNGGAAFPAVGSTPGSDALTDFFAGTLTNGTLLSGDPHTKLTWMSTAGYVQDDWRVTPKLIVNLGLRYEYVTPMKDANNNFGTFDPALGMLQQGHGTDSVWKGDHRAFGPRLGFAYDVNGKGTTVVRGGASLIHSSWVLTTFLGEFGLQNDGSTSLAAVPTGAIITCNTVPTLVFNPCPATGGGTDTLQSATLGASQMCWDPANASSCGNPLLTAAFPAATAQCGNGVAGAPGPCDIMGTNPNLRSPFVANYNVSVTHTFGSNLSVEVGYVGNHGYRLLNFADINQSPLGTAYCLNSLTAAQGADACGPNRLNGTNTPGVQCIVSTNVAINNCPANGQATQEARPFFTKFPYLGFINYATNKSHSRYDSFQLSVNKRMSHGLAFNVGYTYAHGLDNGSLNRFGGLPQDSNNTKAEYASSDFDIRHRLTLTVTYNIPGIKGFAQMLEGWQINSIVNYQTAQPWAAWDGGDNISGTGENADRWNISGNPADFPSGKVAIPYCSSGGAPFTPANVSCNTFTVYGNVPLSTSATTAAITGCAANSPVGAPLASTGCYVSTNGNSFLTPPVLGTYGNMGRNIFRDSGLHTVDLSVFKNFKFKERYGAQFRVEGFNIANHPVAANPYGASSFVNSGNGFPGGGSLGYAGLTPDWAAGNPLIGSGSQRVIQLGLKLTF
jgi:carboxypeptidase family protein